MDLSADEERLARLVREHQAMVYSLARHIVADAAEAEEVAQEVFYKLLQHADELESEEHVRFWLRRVTVRQALDAWRKRRRRGETPLDDAPEPAADAPGGLDPWRDRRLRAAVAALPPEQRVAVVLRYQEDLDPRDIARLLRTSVHTVKSRLQRGLAALRREASAWEPAGMNRP